MTDPRIPFVDLTVTGPELESTVSRIREVLERGWFILGPEVSAFEAELARSAGVKHAVTVASGTDALILALRAIGAGPGDEVIVPAFTAFPTAAAVVEVGATPVLVDVERDRPLLDLDLMLQALTSSTVAVILVHLYGIAADASRFGEVLAGHGRAVLIEDCAQAQGARLPDGSPVGSVGRAAAFSFYPTKNLAALGDGGAVTTQDDGVASEVRKWRAHGESGRRYWHEVPARNSRLDDVQAAVLRGRLASLPNAIERRRVLSARYEVGLSTSARYAAHGSGGAPHLAVMRCDQRDRLAEHLNAAGLATGVHYPFALDEQPALKALAHTPSFPTNAREWARTCLSLPLYPRLPEAAIDEVIGAIASAGVL